MALRDAVATIQNRNAFYRDGYRLLLRISMIQVAIIGLLVASIVGLVVTTQTKQVYFATTTDGRILPLVPLTEAYRSPAEIVTWAAKTSQDVMRFGYFDYHNRLQDASTKFTATGYDAFNKALKDSGLLDAVSSRKLSVTMTVNAAPEITSEGVFNGVFTWDLRFPVTIKFDGAEPPQPTNAELHLRIVRVSTLQVPDGIGIEQWIVVVKQGH